MRASVQPVANSGRELVSQSTQREPVAAAVNSSAPGRIFLWIGGTILILAFAGIVGAVYVSHRVRERISAEIQGSTTGTERTRKVPDSGDGHTTNAPPFGGKHDAPQNDGGDPNVAKGLDAIGGLMDRMGLGDRPANPYQELPVVESDTINKNLCDPHDEAKELPESGAKPAGPSGIPMVKGLMLVHAWGRKFGDSEAMDSVSKITYKYVEVSNNGTFFQNPDDEHGHPDSALRYVCTDDLQTAHGLSTGFDTNGPRTLPGTTTINLSQTLFHELKESGKIDFRYLDYYRMQDLPEGEGYLHWAGGVLTRVESGDVSLQVIVNGAPTTLPAIHASGTVLVESKKARELSKSPSDQPLATELYVLDDSANPLVLLFKQNINNFRIQVTEIHFPLPKPETTIEQDLLKNKKAVVYGIYFDYNSDQIKKESEPVLREIAEAMKSNPDWKLTVDGHTDSIGGDAYNLSLSRRRAAAVKQALVDRFQIGGDHLLTDGFGMRRPVDHNDTLEGRARNRRVELSRE